MASANVSQVSFNSTRDFRPAQDDGGMGEKITRQISSIK